MLLFCAKRVYTLDTAVKGEKKASEMLPSFMIKFQIY